MHRPLRIAFWIALALACGCGEVRQSWEVCAEAARELHRGDARALCGRFSEPMLEALPCDAVERVVRQTVDLLGEPIGECRWAYTYRIQSFDPVQAVAIYTCPFAREAVKVTVAVEATGSGARISGLWTDSPSIRSHPFLLRFELCREIDPRRNACVGKIPESSWSESRISVWNQWQNLRGGDRVAWHWVAPDGEEVTTFEYEVEESPPREYRTWSYIEPANLEVADPYGTWQVRLELNGEPLETFPVRVVR